MASKSSQGEQVETSLLARRELADAADVRGTTPVMGATTFYAQQGLHTP